MSDRSVQIQDPVLSQTAVVIPYYHGEEFISDCLASILDNGIKESGVYVVDNSVKRGGLNPIREIYRDINVIEAPPRLGFGKACNIGADAAAKFGAQSIVFLNQDIVLAPSCLGLMIKSLFAGEQTAISAPINYSHDLSSIEPFYIRYYLSHCPDLIRDALRGGIKPFYRVNDVMGSCFAIKTQLIASLGLFDEIYFMYFEDCDLCRRYAAAGCHIVIVPDAIAGHENTQTGSDPRGKTSLLHRHSSQIFSIKNPDANVVPSVVQFLKKSLLDHLKYFFRFRLGYLFRIFLGDVQLLVHLPKIVASRSAEQKKIRAFQASTLPPLSR